MGGCPGGDNGEVETTPGERTCGERSWATQHSTQSPADHHQSRAGGPVRALQRPASESLTGLMDTPKPERGTEWESCRLQGGRRCGPGVDASLELPGPFGHNGRGGVELPNSLLWAITMFAQGLHIVLSLQIVRHLVTAGSGSCPLSPPDRCLPVAQKPKR